MHIDLQLRFSANYVNEKNIENGKTPSESHPKKQNVTCHKTIREVLAREKVGNENAIWTDFRNTKMFCDGMHVDCEEEKNIDEYFFANDKL